jgi:hypothetical protein
MIATRGKIRLRTVRRKRQRCGFHTYKIANSAEYAARAGGLIGKHKERLRLMRQSHGLKLKAQLSD